LLGAIADLKQAGQPAPSAGQGRGLCRAGWQRVRAAREHGPCHSSEGVVLGEMGCDCKITSTSKKGALKNFKNSFFTWVNPGIITLVLDAQKALVQFYREHTQVACPEIDPYQQSQDRFRCNLRDAYRAKPDTPQNELCHPGP